MNLNEFDVCSLSGSVFSLNRNTLACLSSLGCAGGNWTKGSLELFKLMNSLFSLYLTQT